MKNIWFWIAILMAAGFIGEHTLRQKSEQVSAALIETLDATRAELRSEVDSCDDYVAKHAKKPLCAKGDIVWGEGTKDCVEPRKQASK